MSQPERGGAAGANAQGLYNRTYAVDASVCTSAPTVVPNGLTKLCAITSSADHAFTAGEIYVMFRIDGQWTKKALFFTGGAVAEQTLCNTFYLSTRPSMVKLFTSYWMDDWSFWKLWAETATGCYTVLRENPRGVHGTDIGQTNWQDYWLGAAGWVHGKQQSNTAIDIAYDNPLCTDSPTSAPTVVTNVRLVMTTGPGSSDGNPHVGDYFVRWRFQPYGGAPELWTGWESYASAPFSWNTVFDSTFIMGGLPQVRNEPSRLGLRFPAPSHWLRLRKDGLAITQRLQ
jgi:hypothetical protein